MTTSFEKIWFENLSACFAQDAGANQDSLLENRQRAAGQVADYVQQNVLDALEIFNLRAQKKINFISHRPEAGFSLVRGNRRTKITYEQLFLQIEISETHGYELGVLSREVLKAEIDPFGGIEWKTQNFSSLSNEHLVKKIFLSILDSDLKERLK